MEFTGILSTILKGLIDGALGKAGGDAFGYLLSLVGLGQNQQFTQIESQLQTLESDMTEIETQLNEITDELHAILEEVDWDATIGQVTNPINDIKAHYTTLQQIDQTDTDTAQNLQNWADNNVPNYLETLNNDILPGQGGNDPQQAGLIQMYASYNAQASLKDPNYSATAIGQDSPLYVYYSQIEQYFLYLVGVQLKGLTLLVNAYNMMNEPNLAEAAVQTFQTNLAQQGQVFLSSVEAYTVNYAPDLSLMDIFGQNGAFDPVQRAGQTIDAITGNTTFYLRMWMGSGVAASSPCQPFSTIGQNGLPSFDNNSISSAAGNAPLLAPSGGAPIPADDIQTGVTCLYTQLPPQLNCQWAVFRSSWTNPPDGTYQIMIGGQQLTTLFIDGSPVVNTLVEPSDTQYYFSPATSFTFDAQSAPANKVKANYCGRTSLSPVPIYGYAGDDGGTGRYNFGSGDFTVQCLFNLTQAAGWTETLISSKAAFGAGDNQEAPGASGFILDVTPATPGSDGIQDLVVGFTIDSGYAYAQATTTVIYSFGDWVLLTAGRSAGKLFMYYDDALPTSLNTSGEDPNTLPLSACWNLMFGCKNGNSNMMNSPGFIPVNLYQGYLNEVSVWGRALSLDEVRTMRSQGIASGASGLLGYWSFADGTTRDQTRRANAPNLTAPVLSTASPIYYPAYGGETPAATGTAGEKPTADSAVDA